MLLTFTTTYQPATDLGYLLYENPARVRSFWLRKAWSMSTRTTSGIETRWPDFAKRISEVLLATSYLLVDVTDSHSQNASI